MKFRYLFPVLLTFLMLTSIACRDYEEMAKHITEYYGQELQDAEYVGSETCAACHEKQHREFKLSTHERISIPFEGTKIEGCEMCHGPGSKHVEAEDGKHIINPSKNPEACFACHMEKKAQFRLPHHHPVLEGKMGCTDCHDPHGPEVRPGAFTELEGLNATCAKCHKDQTMPFVWRHEAVEEGCTTCHDVHGSINDKMLIARSAQLCLRCHAQAIYPNVGNSNHGTGRLQTGTCFSAGCHTAVHGSNFDEHLRY